MKFRNFSFLLILIFGLSLVVFCLCHSNGAQPPQFTFKWHIPPSIQARYTEDELARTKARLEEKFTNLASDIIGNFKAGNFGTIGELFSNRSAAFYVDEETTISEKEAIAEYFKKHKGMDLSVEIEVTIYCIDMQRPFVGREGVDFLAVVRFHHGFAKSSDNSPQNNDPPGDVIYFHRKVCTWR